MADWNNPTKDDPYLDVLSSIKGRDVDAISLCRNVPTNTPQYAIRYNRTTNRFEEWSGAAWVTLPLSVGGGGTGTTPEALEAEKTAARAAIGCGSIASQAADAIAITGGSISVPSLTIAAGTLAASGNSDIGTYASQFRYGFFGSGFVVPVGTNKWVPV